MSWAVLIFSGLFETVWAVALTASHGFSRLYPSLLFTVALVISMGGLAYALRTVPVGTGYAVWVGIGAIGTALWGMIALHEPITIARISCLVLIVAGVVGLQLLG